MKIANKKEKKCSMFGYTFLSNMLIFVLVCTTSAFHFHTLPNSNVDNKLKRGKRLLPFERKPLIPYVSISGSTTNNVNNEIFAKLKYDYKMPTNTTVIDPILDDFDEEKAFEQIQNLETLFNDERKETHSMILIEERNYETHALDDTTEYDISREENVNHKATTSSEEWWSIMTPFINESNKDVYFARALLLGAAALYGTNFALIKVLDEVIPVGASTSLRFGLASFATMPWLLPSKREKKSINDSNVKNETSTFWDATIAGMQVGFWVSIGYISQAVGLETTDASKVILFLYCIRQIVSLDIKTLIVFLLIKQQSAFICSLAVVFVPILDAMTGKMLSPRKMLGILMAVSGVGLLEFGESILSMNSGLDLPAISTGDLISFIQPIAFGIGFWRMEHAMEKFPDDACRLTSAQLLSVGLMSLFYCLSGLGGTAPPSLDQIVEWLSNYEILIALAWTGVVTTAMTIYMETLALKSISAAEATLIFSTEPIWGTLFATLIIGEHLGIEAAFGAALILGGCLFSSWNTKSDENELHAKKMN